MRSIKTLALMCILAVFAVSSGCKKSEKVMPVETEIVVKYLNQIASTVNEQTKVNTDNDEKAITKFVTEAIVAPMEKSGYNYDKSINNFAKKVLARDLQTNDPELVKNINDILIFANGVKEVSLKNGQISKETKGLLDQLDQSNQLRGSFPVEK